MTKSKNLVADPVVLINFFKVAPHPFPALAYMNQILIRHGIHHHHPAAVGPLFPPRDQTGHQGLRLPRTLPLSRAKAPTHPFLSFFLRACRSTMGATIERGKEGHFQTLSELLGHDLSKRSQSYLVMIFPNALRATMSHLPELLLPPFELVMIFPNALRATWS